MTVGEPPLDPEDWSDDQWIEWLKSTDIDAGDEPTESPVTRVGRAVHSAGGHALGQAMLGLSYGLYGRRDDEVVVVVQAPSGSGDDEEFTVRLDPNDPERSFLLVHGPPDDIPEECKP